MRRLFFFFFLKPLKVPSLLENHCTALTQAAAADHVGRHRPQLPLGLDVLQQSLVEAGRPRWVWLELAGRDLMGKSKQGGVWIYSPLSSEVSATKLAFMCIRFTLFYDFPGLCLFTHIFLKYFAI